MFLDLVGAYDEISRGLLAAVASVDSQEIADIVLLLLEQYCASQTLVVTAQGLADPYHQLRGVLQGGGLDPLFYILGINLLRVVVALSRLGMPVAMKSADEPLGTVGYVDDTSGPAIDDEGLQFLAYRIRAVIDLLWQRNHSGKMKRLSLDVKGTSVTCVRSAVTWGSDSVEFVKKEAYVKFLGGNANPVGAVAKVRRIIKAACRLVTGRLRNWPTSLQVAHAILAGLVVCKLVFQCIVNIQAKAHLFDMFGRICRAYRVAFGIPCRTPQQCLFKCLGVPSPELVFGATALHEQYKAFCSPKPLSREVSWVHRQRSVPHHLDQDTVRLRALTDTIGIHFPCLSGCDALSGR